MSILRKVTVVVLVLSAVGLAACNNANSGPAETVGNAVDNAAANTGQAISIPAITSKVKAAILAEPGLKVLQINVDNQRQGNTDGNGQLTKE